MVDNFPLCNLSKCFVTLQKVTKIVQCSENIKENMNTSVTFLRKNLTKIRATY